MTRRKKESAPSLRLIARCVLERLNRLPEEQARDVVRFLGLVYLRPADAREIDRILRIGQ